MPTRQLTVFPIVVSRFVDFGMAIARYNKKLTTDQARNSDPAIVGKC
ncbi:hypothetical protein C7476_105198 [Phyllobacterium bourgognense]|uniref:Uncharacterized protein n=1 Tax=Phyllobacterium bourgognense TaxID=314236 RepID=A0A368YZU2_9HYPH|nr:hypothetical protein C7476_105198 [Phyllobacterium bourgognense]